MDVGPLNLRFGAPIALRRCPYCGVTRPQMLPVWEPTFIKGVGRFPGRIWGTFGCTSCGQLVLASGAENAQGSGVLVVAIFPGTLEASDELPNTARTYLQQALETLHAPDAAAVMAGSAVDAMLKAKGYTDGSLYARIDKAVTDHVL